MVIGEVTSRANYMLTCISSYPLFLSCLNYFKICLYEPRTVSFIKTDTDSESLQRKKRDKHTQEEMNIKENS
jgi:hypothetical protein